MREFEVVLKNKGLFNTNRVAIVADRFTTDLMSGKVYFKCNKNKNVAMFSGHEVDYIREIKTKEENNND